MHCETEEMTIEIRQSYSEAWISSKGRRWPAGCGWLSSFRCHFVAIPRQSFCRFRVDGSSKTKKMTHAGLALEPLVAQFMEQPTPSEEPEGALHQGSEVQAHIAGARRPFGVVEENGQEATVLPAPQLTDIRP